MVGDKPVVVDAGVAKGMGERDGDGGRDSDGVRQSGKSPSSSTRQRNLWRIWLA